MADVPCETTRPSCQAHSQLTCSFLSVMMLVRRSRALPELRRVMVTQGMRILRAKNVWLAGARR